MKQEYGTGRPPARPSRRGAWMSYAPSFALDVAGRMAPKTVCKRGLLTVDGIERWVTLEGGELKVYADEMGSGAIILMVSMLYVEVAGNNATPATRGMPPFAANEFRILVEPESVNHEISRNRQTAPVLIHGGGAMGAGGGMLNRAPPTTELSANNVQRRSITLFASSANEKMAWVAILKATAHGRRSWAHARYEAGMAKSGVKEMVSNATKRRDTQ